MAMTTKEEDYAERMVVVSTHDDLMFFTNLGRVYQIKCYQIPEAGRAARGTAMVNILQISGGEKVTNMIPVPADTTGLSLVMATRGGMIKKTAHVRVPEPAQKRPHRHCPRARRTSW